MPCARSICSHYPTLLTLPRCLRLALDLCAQTSPHSGPATRASNAKAELGQTAATSRSSSRSSALDNQPRPLNSHPLSPLVIVIVATKSKSSSTTNTNQLPAPLPLASPPRQPKMAAPTAIPHCEQSSHHHAQHQPAAQQQAPPPNRNSPPAFSPIYTRTAFSLPGGPMSPTSSFRNTASGWTTAGAGVNGLKSPPAVQSHQKAQRDYFPDRDAAVGEGGEAHSMPAPRHHRAFSTSSTSGSSISSIDSSGPTTPGPNGTSSNSGAGFGAGSGAPLGRVPSIGMPSSYEAFKNKRDTWAGGYSHGAGWAGLGGLRNGGEPQSPPGGGVAGGGGGGGTTTAGGGGGGGGGGMGGLLRKLSIGGGGASGHQVHGHGHGHRSMSMSSQPKLDSTNATPNGALSPTSPSAAAPSSSPPKGSTTARGRKNSVGGNTKRKPSPHGERLLMGWTHAH